jgi:hypothetical protein
MPKFISGMVNVGEEEPKFKVGDRVVLIKALNGIAINTDGTIDRQVGNKSYSITWDNAARGQRTRVVRDSSFVGKNVNNVPTSKLDLIMDNPITQFIGVSTRLKTLKDEISALKTKLQDAQKMFLDYVDGFSEVILFSNKDYILTLCTKDDRISLIKKDKTTEISIEIEIPLNDFLDIIAQLK